MKLFKFIKKKKSQNVSLNAFIQTSPLPHLHTNSRSRQSTHARERTGDSRHQETKNENKTFAQEARKEENKVKNSF